MNKKRSTQPKVQHVDLVAPEMSHEELYPEKKSKKLSIVSVVFLIALLGFLYMKKDLFIAAVVDGSPIYTWQLNNTLRARYGEQTLEGLIGEKLIAKQAKKNNIVISQESIDEKQSEILASLGGSVKLDDLLKYQGLTKEEFTNQLKMQMTVEKILTKDLQISDVDIDNYIASNRAMLTATEPALMRDEARKAITTNTVTEKVQAWFAEIRESANIMKFL